MENNVGLKDDRSFGLIVFLSLITLGIYAIVLFHKFSKEVNIVASEHDGKNTMSFVPVFFVSLIALGIPMIIWYHRVCTRIDNELTRRNVTHNFGPKSFWLLSFLPAFLSGLFNTNANSPSALYMLSIILSIIQIVCGLIFYYKFTDSMNKLNASFNEIG